MPPDALGQLIDEEASRAVDFLRDLICYPSLSGQETPVLEYVEETFRPLVDSLERVYFPPDFKSDPEYSSPLPDLDYSGRFNLRLTLDPAANDNQAQETILLNTHCDVVPASRGQRRAFEPVFAGGTIYGRGACDAKGQIALVYLLLRVLRRLPSRVSRRLIIHLVCEEENGGNGTLAMIRSGERADQAIVLEPTGGTVVPSVRGAVWFRITCRGQAGHSGSPEPSISALKSMLRVMQLLEEYHGELLEQSRGILLFDEFENPMPLTFGILNAGNWPASSPDEARLEGVLGFLPNRDRKTIMCEIGERLWDAFSQDIDLDFMYRHDCHVLAPSHPLVGSLQRACASAGQSQALSGFPASCDSWYYHNLLGIPTVVFGPGHLRHAHSAEEQIEVRDIGQAARVLLSWINGDLGSA